MTDDLTAQAQASIAHLFGTDSGCELLVVSRYHVDVAEQDEFNAAVDEAIGALSLRPGFIEARYGRSIDEPGILTLTSRWQDVGSYRRALSSFDVKMRAVPLLSRAVDEPSAFEVLIERTASSVRTFRSSRDPEGTRTP